jgi:hypothetical protein
MRYKDIMSVNIKFNGFWVVVIMWHGTHTNIYG